MVVTSGGYNRVVEKIFKNNLGKIIFKRNLKNDNRFLLGKICFIKVYDDKRTSNKFYNEGYYFCLFLANTENGNLILDYRLIQKSDKFNQKTLNRIEINKNKIQKSISNGLNDYNKLYLTKLELVSDFEQAILDNI